jgi:hypothetical protein
LQSFDPLPEAANISSKLNKGQCSTLARHGGFGELERASMLIEWIRRHEPLFDKHLREYLFTDKPVVEVEHQAVDRGDPIKP